MSNPIDVDEHRAGPIGSADSQHVILIAEGNQRSAGIYQTLLQNAGYAVVVVAYDDTAAAARQLRPSLIILQVADPAVSGLGLLRELRTDAETRGTPLVTLVRFDNAHAREQIVRAGAAAIFIEPVKPPMLLRQVRRLLAIVLMSSQSSGAARTAAVPVEASRA